MIAVIGMLLYSAFKWEFSNKHVYDKIKVEDSDEKEAQLKLSDVVLISIGAVCQQGKFVASKSYDYFHRLQPT